MSFQYWLPDDKGNKIDYETEENAVVIIGANGAGKSKLGAWIECQDFEKVHRVGAQRNLNFNENLQLKSYANAENMVLFGDYSGKQRNKGPRWGYGNQYTTKLMDDFDDVLAALIALKNNENDRFVNECKKSNINKSEWPDAPNTAIDKLISIWKQVFPQRDIIEEDSKFYAVFNRGEERIKYPATQMSDGERSVLYLASQVLCVPENKTLIIDEPEVHLNRSIMNRLWKALESYRTDCLFIYITHDLAFASSHGNVDKIWIKNYIDDNNWSLERIENDDLPEELLLEILGSRKNVLFVEGEKNSYDYQLYVELYPDYHVIPCGSCHQVISRTRAFNNSRMLHECKVFGLIDRDYRSEDVIESYKKDNIFVLGVAEIENLFFVEEIVKLMAGQFGENIDEVFSKVKDYVIDIKFKNMINQQICQSVVAEIKHRLSSIEIETKNDAKAKESLNTALSKINYEEVKKEKEKVFEAALNKRDYSEVLKLFNEKDISCEIGRFFNVDRREYQKKVVNLLRGNLHTQIIEALKPYLPDEIK